jgi:hypothetical protein
MPFWVVIALIVAVASVTALLMSVGGRLEEKRIYEQCETVGVTALHDDHIIECNIWRPREL